MTLTGLFGEFAKEFYFCNLAGALSRELQLLAHATIIRTLNRANTLFYGLWRLPFLNPERIYYNLMPLRLLT
jgi:hypothetical protein